MTPLSRFEQDSDKICNEISNENYEVAKSLYESRIQSLDSEEKKILDLYINTKLNCSLEKFQKAIEDGFDGLFKEIRAINQKLWGRDTAINGANAK